MALIILFMTLYSLSISSGGVSGIAPFSPPAVAGLLGMNGSIWGCMEILLCRDIFSERERAARRILLSAPVSPAQYYAPKVAAAFLVTIALAGFSLLIIGCSLWGTYGVLPLGALAAGFGLFSLPSLVFVLGASLVLGRLHPGILYGFFFVTLLFGTVSFPLPLWLDLFGNLLAVDISYQVALRSYAGEPLTVILPWGFLVGRMIFSAAGLLGLGGTVFRRGRG
jgi:ABC-type transport system involved in multi-copper enzyme maturation permease subunit